MPTPKLEFVPMTQAKVAELQADPGPVGEVCRMQGAHYDQGGYEEPWIGYLVQREGLFIGSCAFKGRPKDGRVEIAYHTFHGHEGRGHATAMCRELVRRARQHQPSIVLTARTMPQRNPATTILERNGFALVGTVMDDADQEVWEWLNEAGDVSQRPPSHR
jgi:RimJ/RimL family protein N-acetyltransferase